MYSRERRSRESPAGKPNDPSPAFLRLLVDLGMKTALERQDKRQVNADRIETTEARSKELEGG